MEDNQMAAIQAAKKELRKLMRKRLSQLSQADVSVQSSLVTRKLQQIPAYQNAKRISIYLSMPEHELETDALVRYSLSDKKQVFVPYLFKNPDSTDQGPTRLMTMLALRNLDDYQSLQRDTWGIPTISDESMDSRENCFGGIGIFGEPLERGSGTDRGLDVMIMPGLAFDGNLNRLGHGRGFFDRFLSLYSRKRSETPYLIGVALKEQIVEDRDVPNTNLDWKLDGLIVGDGRYFQGSQHKIQSATQKVSQY